MPRPRLLPLDGVRRTITLPPGLDEELAVLAARRRTSVSLVIQALLTEALAPRPRAEEGEDALAFPGDWDGTDLRNRLLILRMRQKDLAADLGVHPNTLNGWVRGEFAFPAGMLEGIQEALRRWDPAKGQFRWASRSPRPR